MDQRWIEVITALAPILVAALMSIPGILSYRNTRKRDKAEGVAIVKSAEKSDAEAKAVIVTAAKGLLEPYMEKVTILEERDAEREAQLVEVLSRLAGVERNNFILCDGVRRLILQIKSLGAVPVFEIDDELCKEMSNGQN